MSQQVIFMGTPDFAVASLRALLSANVNVAAVVTSPDRPAGRGRQIQESAVKKFAVEHNLKVLQPEKLKNEDFLTELQAINADLFVVVAFRMLPTVVWDMPPKGTINLHGSLLPNYRGAAPINWAVINGETETGATTFFIEKEIDTGKVIDHVKIPIAATDNAGDVHDALMEKGAVLLKDTVLEILNGTVEAKDQAALMGNAELKHAPKIFKPDCEINWNNTTQAIYNKIRGLSPYPTAWTKLNVQGKSKTMKLFTTKMEVTGQNNAYQINVTPEHVKFGTADGWIELLSIQLEGKKRMSVEDFRKGFDFEQCTLEESTT